MPQLKSKTLPQFFALIMLALAAGGAFAIWIVRAAPFQAHEAILLAAVAFAVGYMLAVVTYRASRTDS